MEDSHWWQIGSGFLGGLLAALLLDPFKMAWEGHWFNPKLDATFDEERCKVGPIERNGYVEYVVRMRVTNSGRTSAHECVGYLEEIRRCNPDGTPVASTEYNDYLPLKWAYHPKEVPHVGITLHAKASNYLDVFTVRPDRERPLYSTVRSSPRYDHLCETDGLYRLTIRVVADKAKPREVYLYLRWTGAADTWRASMELEDVRATNSK